METRAHHLLVGSFVLLFIAGIFAFTIWVAKLRVDTEYARYRIVFTDSVAGLGEGGDVRFNGIKVGAVKQILIDPDDPSRVRVNIDVDPATPIREDSTATLEAQGITGVYYVAISGGSPQAAMLEGGKRGKPPVIRSRPSKFSELFQGAPDLLNRSVQLIDRGADILNEQNRQNLAGILTDLKQVTGAISAREAAMTRIIDAFDQSSQDIVLAARSVREITAKLDNVMTDAQSTLGSARNTLGNIDALAEDGRSTAKALTKLSGQLDLMVAENREPIKSITTEGFGDIRRFVNEARLLVDSLSRVAARIEEDPSSVLFGSRDAQFKPQGK